MARKHKLDEVLVSLNKKNDIQIKGFEIRILTDTVYNTKLKKTVPNPKKRHDLGNGSLGKIDYLVNYHGFFKSYVSEFKSNKRR